MKPRFIVSLFLTLALLMVFSGAQAAKSKVDYNRAMCGDKCLAGTCLEKANFKNQSLSCTDFRGADLYKAKFNNADLRGVDFSCADLSKANLKGADLTGANLAGANLEGAKMKNTIGPDGCMINPD